MRRTRGNDWHPHFEWLRRVVSRAKLYHGDPSNLFRHFDNSRYNTPWQESPQTPNPLSPYALAQDFQFKSPEDLDPFTVANSGTGTALTIQDERGGVAKFTNGAADNNYYSYYSTYEFARLAGTNKGLWFSGRFKIADVDQADVFIGLSAKLGAGNIFDTRVDSIGLYMSDGSGDIIGESSKDSTASNTGAIAAATDDAWVSFVIQCFGTGGPTFFVDVGETGEWESASLGTNVPDDEEMSVWFGCRNGQASANSMSVGRMVLCQDIYDHS